MGIPLHTLPPHVQQRIRSQPSRSAVKARGRKRPATGMNKTEARYEQHLQGMLSRGEIVWYRFEPIKLKLADRTFYTPDFAVMLPDGLIELHDVKGRKGDKFWAEEDAMVKIKAIAEMYPFTVCVVWERKGGGGWDRRDY